jgi:hypothetical protein
MKEVLLGFEVGTAEPVYIKPGHLIVTGITQRSGKTTTLEGLITRSKLKAIAFKTKPGEAGFSIGKVIPPFFVEHSDWKYVESLMGAVMGEKMKFERSWIIRACRGAETLEDVDKNILERLKNTREQSLDYGVYTSLHAYFQIVLPQLKDTQFSKELTLYEGVNIMDLEEFSDELQSLVIRSVLEYVLRNERETVVIIPEAWKFVPEGRGSPAKQAAEMLIRQGAAKSNYVWIDSQDLAGVDKGLLKQVSNWILGLQLERNEVQHTLDQIPLPNSMKPKTDRIMTLKLGHFFYCSPEMTKAVYVMPSWVNEEIAKKVALGQLAPEQIADRKRVKIEEISFTQESAIASMREQLNSQAKLISKNTKERDQALDRVKTLEMDVKRLRQTRGVPIEKYMKLKDIDRKYNTLLRTIKQLVATPEVPVVEVQPPVIAEEKPGSVIPSLQPTGLQQTYTIPLEKNLMLQKLGGAPKKIYETLMQSPQGLTKAQIGLMTGYAFTSGSFANCLSKLKTMGLIKREGEIYKVV